MKKIFSSLLFAGIVITGLAQERQDAPQHLVFKGVPIDGTLADYVSKMKQNGFTHIQTEDGTAILNGDFAGYKGCTVGVSTIKQRDLVYVIAVIFPAKDTWSTLSGNYFDLKEMLTEKYGNPSGEDERFDRNSQPRDDEDRMYEVKFDNCKYSSTWNTDNGKIQLSIGHSSVTSCYVTLAYLDKINCDKIKSKSKDDL